MWFVEVINGFLDLNNLLFSTEYRGRLSLSALFQLPSLSHRFKIFARFLTWLIMYAVNVGIKNMF